MRVGTEDYARNRWGRPPQASEFAAETTALVEALGRNIACPDEARALLKITPVPPR